MCQSDVGTIFDLGSTQAMAERPRGFPPPWRAEPIPGGYVVRDVNGQALAYLYSRDNEDEARQAKVLTKDEARRIAINLVARLPEAAQTGGRRLGYPAGLRLRALSRRALAFSIQPPFVFNFAQTPQRQWAQIHVWGAGNGELP